MHPSDWVERYEVWENNPDEDLWRVAITTSDEAEALLYYELLLAGHWNSVIVEHRVYA